MTCGTVTVIVASGIATSSQKSITIRAQLIHWNFVFQGMGGRGGGMHARTVCVLGSNSKGQSKVHPVQPTKPKAEYSKHGSTGSKFQLSQAYESMLTNPPDGLPHTILRLASTGIRIKGQKYTYHVTVPRDTQSTSAQDTPSTGAYRLKLKHLNLPPLRMLRVRAVQ